MKAFKKAGWVYLPVSIFGIVITAMAFAFCVNVFIVVDRNSHSISDTLYGFFPFAVGALTVLFWIASNTSDKK